MGDQGYIEPSLQLITTLSSWVELHLVTEYSQRWRADFCPSSFHHKLYEANMLNTWSSPQEAIARSLTIIIGLKVRTKPESPLGSKCDKTFHAYICMNSNLTGVLAELETSVSCVWKVSFQSLWSWHVVSGSYAVKHSHTVMSTAWSTYLAVFLLFQCYMSALLKVAIHPGNTLYSFFFF